ncbi:MAX gene-associated protein isoform X3 [Micropterus dolomieu]|uniref:MAX gene-associated protein isoform X3 n=1 Tax=Micropterus dolomieu TaxID=147949 RepID=UPI001E8D0B26|nr:MAX gene-associated protein isoform X3 [Micropterus dolomieu]
MMPATDSELASMEDPCAMEDEEGSLTNIPSAVPPTTVPSSTPNFPSETVIETKAVSMASNDCISAWSSPAEASPAKPAVMSPTTFDGTVEASPATSHIASASDSLKCTGTTSIVNISESPPSLPVLPSSTFGSPDLENDFPPVLTFKGVSVTLENNSVWKQFYSCGTEMILTKYGRRMFPYCRYRLAGLDPERQYSLVLSIVPSDQYRYRWSTSKWEITGAAEHQAQGLLRAFSHHYSPCRGSEWMGGLVSFYKLKLTNNSQDQDGHIILHSMHRYIPRLHVIPVPDGDAPTPNQPVVMGAECMTFTFPQTEFMAVTTYQNFRITQLKISHNPFAKGFREDGNNPRLNRVTTEAQPVVKTDTQPLKLKCAELNGNTEGVVDLSTKNHTISSSLSNEIETRLVLKPIMSANATKDEPYVPCIRGKHALGELVLVQKRPLVEPNEETHAASLTPKVQRGFKETPTAISMTRPFATATPGSSPEHRKRKKRINRRWANSRGREWKAAAVSPAVVHSPSLAVAMQPELDDVEGMLFVSFTSKEALEVHVRDMPPNSKSSASPVSLTTPIHSKQTMVVTQETDEEKIVRLEAILLQDLRVLKHRQGIHPVLQEVGLKLSSLDPTKSIDLQYLGVHLPLPPPNLPKQGNATSLTPGDEGLPFISRTGKTSDMTKIKGWKSKFMRNKESSPSNCDGSQKNLSAFCSNLLDEYLESEAQYISERAAAFSTNPEGSVAYQMPAKSASYVKTLDSVLKHQNAASKSTAGANRPCPLSHKPLLYSVLASPFPPLASPATAVQAAAQSVQPSASSHTQPVSKAASESSYTSSVPQRLSTHHPGVSQRPAVSSGQSQGMTHRPSGVTKLQFKLLLMEIAAQNMGLSRTQLTPDRLSVALSVMLTKQMLPSQVLKVAPYPASKAEGHECGQEFCRLGCVCSSLQHSNRGPLHCRRPDCMFGCACFKSKITKQMTAQEDEQHIEPLYSMTNMEHVVQPRPGSHANKLWNRNIHDVDPEPLFAPKSAPLCLVPLKFQKRSSVPRPTQPIREEDKDPVYKYLESMMTCARVREFNSKPPPELTIEPKIPETSTPNTKAKLQETTTDNLPKKYNRTLLTVKKAAENTSQGTKSNETQARKQIEIQSACQWDKDSKMVLEALCQRMNQNRLSQRFWVGPYHIRPVAKIFMRKPSGAMVTYRVHISKPSKTSDNDGDEFDDSGEERHANKNLGEDIEAEEEDGKIEEPEMQFGVTPFLSGVLPAGRLKARTKPVDCRAYGLIQVNGKSYNQARLLLGNMGSLHPANRLAAYVTSRLHAPADISQGNSQKSDPTNKINTPDALHMKAAGTLAPPIITARKTTDLKTPTQQPVQLFQTDSWRKGPITLPQNSQNSTSIHPVQTFVSGQRSSVSSFQNSSTSSPVSLTVSPALKTPSFLGQSGTYSFRICPPANQGTRDQNLPGVTLPGGFTLIQLPKPGAAQQSVRNSVNTTNMAGRDKGLVQKDALYNSGHFTANSDTNWLGVDTLTGAKDLSSSRQVEPGSSPELVCEEKMPSDEIDEANCRRVESNLDITSEDLSSDYSDDCGEGDEDDEVVDIETVEEVRQGLAIAKMKEAASKALRESRDSSEGFGSTRGLEIQDQMEDIHDECKDKRRRKNHTVLERQRRSEQRTLFDKLQTVLQSDPRAPRLRLLSLALKEIQNLVETSRHLEEKKRRLTRMQSVYVKELSLLSGKSDTLIKHKLKEICERQKIKEKTMKWRPFFSQLLQSRAALLQAITPQSKPQPRALLQPDFFMTPSVALPHTTAAQNSLKSPMPTPAVSSEGLVDVTAPSPQAGNLPGEPVASVQVGQRQPKFEGQQEIPGAPAQFSTPNSQTECHPQIPSVAATIHSTVAQDGASAIFSTPNSSNSSAHPPQSFALPLIRSKTGRIILPSSLKPIGQGFYTLMFMKAKQNEEEAECSSSANVQPSDVDSFNNQEKGFTESDHHSDSERRRILEDKTVQSSNSEPNRSGGTAPLAELALLNKSIFVPSVALQAVENSQKEGTVVGLNKTLATAGMAFNHVRQIDASVKLEPDPSAPAVRRRRGRPRKNPITPVSENEKRTLVEDTSESETSILVGERQSEVIKTQAEDTPERVIDNPVPVKRGRGRPPKKKSAQLWSPAIVLAGSSPSKSNEDSPVRLSRHFKSPDAKPKESSAATILHEHMTTSRPLTRGSLGKDFPSAKKRSWIDIEKELEPELESE